MINLIYLTMFLVSINPAQRSFGRSLLTIALV